jgi:hypothetical protein
MTVEPTGATSSEQLDRAVKGYRHGKRTVRADVGAKDDCESLNW